MACKCISCGKTLKAEESISRGIGPECIRKGRSSYKNSRTSVWREKVDRGVSLYLGKPVVIGNRTFNKVGDVWISDGISPISEESFGPWLRKWKLIPKENDIGKNFWDKLLSGKSIESVIEGIDK